MTMIVKPMFQATNKELEAPVWLTVCHCEWANELKDDQVNEQTDEYE